MPLAEAQNGSPGEDRVAWPVVLGYGAPAIGAGYMYLLVGLYVMKFSTDVLLIAPAFMGLIFSISRVWDAVSDPLVGYLSDRTSGRFGRRRIWIAGSLAPIGAMFVMVFAPPEDLGHCGLHFWMGAAVIGFYSAMTLFFVPHLSLGAELSECHHERSRLFGARHAFYTLGAILALASMQLLIEAKLQSQAAVRGLAFDLALAAALAMAVMSLLAMPQLRERADFQGRVPTSPLAAFRDVWRNIHARLLILLTFIEYIGFAAIGVLTLYVMQYIVGAPRWAPLVILSYMIPSAFSVPLWLPLSRRFGKARLWTFSLLLTGVSFGGMFALPFLCTLEARLSTIFVLAFFAGLGGGCGGTIGPSVLSDVVDYDEQQTGERKEGAYYAAWKFAHKSSMGLMLAFTGLALQAAGFTPNVEQSMMTQVVIAALYSLMPLICYIVGAAVLSRFKFDESAHAGVRAALDVRRVRSPAGNKGADGSGGGGGS